MPRRGKRPASEDTSSTVTAAASKDSLADVEAAGEHDVKLEDDADDESASGDDEGEDEDEDADSSDVTDSEDPDSDGSGDEVRVEAAIAAGGMRCTSAVLCCRVGGVAAREGVGVEHAPELVVREDL